MHKTLALALLTLPAFIATPAMAQYYGGQVPPPENSAQAEIQNATLEDEVRQLRGQLEENQFEIRKLSETVEKLQRDTEYRFNALNGGAAAATAPAAGTPSAAPPVAITGPTSAGTLPPGAVTMTPPASPEVQPAPPGVSSGGDGVLRLPPEGNRQDPSSFNTPREHYYYAFRLLSQQQYEAAAAAFETFTKKYPKDPLIGNAYYWEGESYYIRHDYVNAADNFRQGFEALPNGPKAADNLLKLSMSLTALNRDKEACVVLQQITTKFKKSSTSVTEKAAQEQKRIGCKA